MFTDLCPKCQTTDWEYTGTELQGDLLIHQCWCPQCKTTWTEVFVFVENKNIVTK